MEKLLIASAPGGKIICLKSNNGFVSPFSNGDEVQELRDFLVGDEWKLIDSYVVDVVIDFFEKS